MNVGQFRFAAGHTHFERLRVVTTKLVNIVILRQNDCDERMYERNKEKKTTDTVLSVCWTSERGDIPNAVEDSAKMQLIYIVFRLMLPQTH